MDVRFLRGRMTAMGTQETAFPRLTPPEEAGQEFTRKQSLGSLSACVEDHNSRHPSLLSIP